MEMLKSAFSSPKIRTLAARLGIPFPHAVGMCGMLWNFTADHAPQGNVGKHSDAEIAMSLEWPGDPEALIAAMIAVRLIDTHPDYRLLVHDWRDHAPRYVLANLQRKNLAFIQPDGATTVATTVGTVDGSAVETTSSSASSYTSSSPSTSTFSYTMSDAAHPPAPTRSAKPKRSKPVDPICWTVEAGWKGITDADHGEWVAAYPACDIPRQLAAMAAWLKANPVKARKSAWRKFVTNWLSRQQDRGGDAQSKRAESRNIAVGPDGTFMDKNGVKRCVSW